MFLHPALLPSLTLPSFPPPFFPFNLPTTTLSPLPPLPPSLLPSLPPLLPPSSFPSLPPLPHSPLTLPSLPPFLLPPLFPPLSSLSPYLPPSLLTPPSSLPSLPPFLLPPLFPPSLLYLTFPSLPLSLLLSFPSVWADNADYCSVQYAGTGALKTDFTRTGKRTYLGAVKDGLNSATRYYYNNFADGVRQVSTRMPLYFGCTPKGMHSMGWPSVSLL